ncbi:hypothetical protein GGI43DRAFT_416465 [Trichoderma evansii]
MLRNKRPSAAVGRSSSAAYPFVDALRTLNPTEQETRAKPCILCEDMYNLSLKIDSSFSHACRMFIRLAGHPTTVNEDEMNTFETHITTYKTKVFEIKQATDHADAMTTISRALACVTFIETIWGPVLNYLSESPETRYNNKPPWTSWVSNLNETTKDLPGLLTRVWASPRDIYTTEQWQDMVAKVEFLDSTIDFAFTNEYAGLGLRNFHIGTEINKAMAEALPSANKISRPLFQEKTPNNPKYGTWKGQPASMTEAKSIFSRLGFWVGVITFASGALGIPGWLKSSMDAGKLMDGGHWFLIQTCILQYLSIIITIFASEQKFGKTLWALAIASLICSTVAPFVYTVSPIPCSTTVAFGGAALSNFVIQYTLLLPTEIKSHTS